MFARSFRRLLLLGMTLNGMERSHLCWSIVLLGSGLIFLRAPISLFEVYQDYLEPKKDLNPPFLLRRYRLRVYGSELLVIIRIRNLL